MGIESFTHTLLSGLQRFCFAGIHGETRNSIGWINPMEIVTTDDCNNMSPRSHTGLQRSYNCILPKGNTQHVYSSMAAERRVGDMLAVLLRSSDIFLHYVGASVEDAGPSQGRISKVKIANTVSKNQKKIIL